ncbi:rhodanese-like domain-containing protein [Paraferrimonas sedimenticola]|uniref:Sulfurtransferase n=1 Tax=Paraferrimonas sedimenticola TaxID=375674 RepID=A0AA37RUG7_9GAMM|nr:rhodanese-like domain-containing protein [Paraferrimonas sedimenticola]GLP95406.1 sulfurtransferase [Paraferrimonas sedimenticola]
MQHNPRFEKLCQQAVAQIQEISLAQYQDWVSEARSMTLVDVREQSEWAVSHLPNAEYLGKGVIERDVEKRYPDLDQVLVLYCGGGYRSALAALNLQLMGYRQVYSLAGGFRGWNLAGLPLQTPAQ